MRFKGRVTSCGLFNPAWNRREDAREWFSKTAWLNFSAEFGEVAFDAIARRLELDVDDTFSRVARYVSGGTRVGAAGPTSSLGDFGEAFTYWASFQQGLPLLRIVGTSLGRRAKRGEKLPTPDFVLRLPGSVGAVEVKTTEALALHDLEACKKWMFLAPCDQVSGLRAEALPQLGHSNNRAPGYVLKSIDGTTVPFPCDYGVAIGLVVRDGRLPVYQHNDQYKTPKLCAGKKLDCWSCMALPQDLSVVVMRNEPGLSLLGSDTAPRFWNDYSRWEGAVWTRHIQATRSSTSTLLETAMRWLPELRVRMTGSPFGDANDPMTPLKQFWTTYLGRCLTQRGLADATGGIVSVEGAEFEPRAVVVEMPEVLGTVFGGLRRANWSHEGDLLSMDVDGSLHVRVASREWSEGNSFTSRRAARTRCEAIHAHIGALLAQGETDAVEVTDLDDGSDDEHRAAWSFETRLTFRNRGRDRTTFVGTMHAYRDGLIDYRSGLSKW